MVAPGDRNTTASRDRLSSPADLEWTDLAAPSAADIEGVCAELSVPPEFAMAPSERPLRDTLPAQGCV